MKKNSICHQNNDLLLQFFLNTYSFEQICEILNLKHDSSGVHVGTGTFGPLTLFQPGGANYAKHIILISPPSFESHRRACKGQ